MAIPVWPVGLPQIALLAGWELAQAHRPLATTQFEDGPDRQRPVSVSDWTQHNLAFLMTQAQFTTFYNFVRDTLDQGSSRFTMPVWAPWRAAGTPARTVYIIGGDFKAPRDNQYHRVSFTLAVLDW